MTLLKEFTTYEIVIERKILQVGTEKFRNAI
jgi:hypothetical protein